MDPQGAYSPLADSPLAESDRDLVLAFQAGDKVAYDEMYRRYHLRVISVCSRVLHNPQDAEEATQETFLRAYQALARFNGNFRLGAWLSKIAANTSVDVLRAKMRAPLVALPDEPEAAGSESGPEDVVVGHSDRLQEALGEIKPLHATALALRDIQGMSHREMASHLSMSPDQVKALIHRARVSLRRAWDRAEGWALAPLLLFRPFSHRSHEQAGSPFVGVAPALTPLLAEKVAATALAVVAVLGGFPSAPQVVDPKPPALGKLVSAPDVAADKASLLELAVSPSESSAAPAGEAKADPVAELVPHISGTIGGHTHFDDPEEQEEQDPDDPTGSATHTAKGVVEKVRDVLEHPPTAPTL
jgi:RNA polymerase sigma-70 factor, ECF subfamily